jgi:flagellar hook protein FlgE
MQVGTGVRVEGFAADNSPGPSIVGPEGELVELSNTDVGENLVDLILASGQFSANAAVFGTADQLLDELVHLGRQE